MKTIHTLTEPIQFPAFWNEEWLKIAIDELDSRKMTPDEKANFEMIIARNAEAVNAEKQKTEKAIVNFLSLNLLTTKQIAYALGVSEEFVKNIQQQNK